MDIKQLVYFLKISEEKNITKAAEKLHIAQPHLSHQLKLLEEELGVKLVERSTRKFQLTKAGEMLLHRSEQIVELMNSTVKELKDFSEGIIGTLSIGTIASSGDTLLPVRVNSFNKKYPKINFEIRECSTIEILDMLRSGIIEIGIIRTPLNSDEFETIYLPNEPMVAAANREEHLAFNKDSIDLIDLADKPLLVHRRYENMIVEACKRAGFEPRVLCKIEDTKSILLWANTGMGVAIIPRDWIGIIPSINLGYKVINEESLLTRTVIVWRKDHYLSTVAKNFIETFRIYNEISP